MAETVVIGVDLGGTTISAGAVKNNTVLVSKKRETGRTRPAENIVADIISLIESVAGGYAPEAIGIGVPTPAGPRSETFVPAINLPTMDNYPLRARLSEHFGVAVCLENDANCMTMGEYCAGALRGVQSGVCLTLGTGLGCGIILNGSLVRGARYSAGEIWNIPNGDEKTLEDTVSIDELRHLSKIHMGFRIEPHELFGLYQAGDSDANAVWRKYGRSVGKVVSLILALFDPERIVLGGGIAGAYDAFRESMIEEVSQVYGDGADSIIQAARLSEEAAIIGAALLAQNRSNNSPGSSCEEK